MAFELISSAQDGGFQPPSVAISVQQHHCLTDAITSAVCGVLETVLFLQRPDGDTIVVFRGLDGVIVANS